MAAPKSPQVDLEHKRSLYILIGYVIAASFLYAGLEWRNGGTDSLLDDEYTFREDFVPITWDIPQDEVPVLQEELQVAAAPAAIVQEMPEEIHITDSHLEAASMQKSDSQSVTLKQQPQPVATTETDRMAEFPGGIAALRAYVYKNVIYPADAMQQGIAGTVLCTFIITETGTITDVMLLKGVTPEMDNEALRVIRQMPRWKPCVKNGYYAPVRYVMPVVFRLH
ncbi:MAG: energy transducer TonB [Bacteroidales bacterium]|jgi:protein TonB|nr:energy transducer TonB [Bacteroidales bacterium]